MSLTLQLAKQNLTSKRNDLIMQQLRDSRMQRQMLNSPSFTGNNLEAVNAMETSLAMNNITNSTQLMAIDAELGAINQSLGANLNYLA